MTELWNWWGRAEMWVHSETMLRLVMALLLGGIVGLERELKHKPAGLRTNMLICFGAAMFTILSDRLASQFVGDHTRIAAQIIPGIGFIGAGSIIQSRGSVTGLTTAATLFVVASIGMAAGGGQYLPAVFATFAILVALYVLGWVETRWSLKATLITYLVTGREAEQVLAQVSQGLSEAKVPMHSVQVSRRDTGYQMLFRVEGSPTAHEALFAKLRRAEALQTVERLGSEVEE